MSALSACLSLEDTLKVKLKKRSFYEHAHPKIGATKPQIFLYFLSFGRVVILSVPRVSDETREELIVQGEKCRVYVKV